MKKVTIYAAGVFAAGMLAGCGQASAGCGIASPFTPGSGAREESHKQMDISAAHQSLPVGTRVIVRNQRTGRSIVVRIVDRNPSLLGRIIDLSTDAMSALGMDALAPVCVEVVTYGSPSRAYRQIKARNTIAGLKHADVVAPDKKGSSVSGSDKQVSSAVASDKKVSSVSAHVRTPAKSASVAAAKAKRYAQAHRRKQAAKGSSHRRGHG